MGLNPHSSSFATSCHLEIKGKKVQTALSIRKSIYRSSPISFLGNKITIIVIKRLLKFVWFSFELDG